MNDDLAGTISIVSHGHGPLLRQLLSDLADQADIDSWLVIVTLNIPEAFPTCDYDRLRLVVLRNNTARGFGENHNAAARQAQGKLFLIVNPDIRLTSRATLTRLAGMAWPQRPVLRAPVVVGPDGTPEDSVRRNLSPFNLLRRLRARPAGWEASPGKDHFFWLAGMFLAVPLEAFRSLGGFDERFRLYCEDYDLSARWRIAGGDVQVIPDLEVVHDARRDSHRSLRHLRWHLASLARVWISRPFWQIATGRYGRVGLEENPGGAVE